MTDLPFKGNADSMDNVAVTREQFRQDIGEFLEYIAQALGNVPGAYTTEAVDPTAVILQGTPTIDANPPAADSSLRIPSTSWVQSYITSGGAIGNGQINFNAGNGLAETGTNALANQNTDTTKTFSIQASNNSLTVDGTGISVNVATLAADFLRLTGGNLTGGVTQTERTITAGAFDLATGNFWTAGAIAVPNPTNAVAGMSGLIRFTAQPTGFGANFRGTPGVTTTPAIVPFYVEAPTVIRLGKAVEVA